MQALILVGGEGTRLRPLTLTVPKPVLPLADRPFIRFVIDWLTRHGVDDIVLACGFLAHGLRDVLGEGGDAGPRLRYVEEPQPLGTAGAIKFAEPLLDDRFLALNGDVLTDIDLGALLRRHEESAAVATLALYPVGDPSAYGLVRRTDDGEVVEFIEKPDPGQIETDEISAGAYVLEAPVLDLIREGGEVSIEREVFPRLVGEGLYAERLEGYWTDIGTPERYLQATWDILEGRVENEVTPRLDADRVLVEPGAILDPAAEVQGPALIESGAAIEAGARIGGRAVLGRGCRIAAEASVEESVLHRGCRVGAGARIGGSILAAGVEVGDEATLGEAVIGEAARIGSGAELHGGARVQPADAVPGPGGLDPDGGGPSPAEAGEVSR